MSQTRIVVGSVALAVLIASAFGGTAPYQRGNNNQNHGGGQPRQSGGGNRGGVQPRQNNQPVHAQRDQVRTQNFVPRPTNRPAQGGQRFPGGPVTRPAFGQRPVNPGFGGGRPQQTIRPGQPNFGGQRPGQPARPGQPDLGGQRPGQPNFGGGRPTFGRARPNQASLANQRTFTRTSSGRVYDNGLRLRRGAPVATWQRRFFPRGHVHFPFYRQSFVRGSTFISPWGFYFGIGVPFIEASAVNVFPPSVSWIDMPIYSGDAFTGFGDSSDENLLNDPNLDQDFPGIGNALDDLTETYQSGNVDSLVSLIDPNMEIAIYARGHYKYSMHGSDFVDLTRDAFQGLQTIGFDIQYLHERGPGVFSVSAEHTYRDETGATQSMWVSFVLQDINGQWTLTQVGTAPARWHSLIG